LKGQISFQTAELCLPAPFFSMTLIQNLGLKFIRTKFALISRISKKEAAKKAFELFITPQSRVKIILPPLFQKAERLHFSLEGDSHSWVQVQPSVTEKGHYPSWLRVKYCEL
jgi:hypothetical protein